MNLSLRRAVLLCLSAVLLVGSGCRATRPGATAPRKGDEIVAAGQFFHTGTKVVLWMDPGGYDAYRVERRFSPFEQSSWADSKAAVKDLSTPNRYNLRKDGLTPEQIEQVRGGGWDLPLLQNVVDQFVIHYDAAGTSRQCFTVLQDHRDLSVHFLLDLDGTIYQTLDMKERAWHASASNSRAVGVEIANMGAYGSGEKNPLDDWYRRDANGQTTITIPARFGNGGIRTPRFVGHPTRPEPVTGAIHGHELVQYDFTPQQYEALTKLTAAICTVFPKIKCTYPADASGKPLMGAMPDAEQAGYQGVLGHYHLQTNKSDPGPAFQWDRVIGRAQQLMVEGDGAADYRTTMPHGKAR